MRISVVTPSYNQAAFVERAIGSVLSQTGDFELEYIVMDGGSTDGTVEILRHYDDRLTWLSEKDKGQSDAINKAFKLTTGEIIGWLNSDDYYAPGALAATARCRQTHPDSVAWAGVTQEISSAGEARRRLVPRPG